MPVLHPIFLLIFFLLMLGSSLEMFIVKKKQLYIFLAAALLMIIAVGLRANAGADYPIYRDLYGGFGILTGYDQVLHKALFMEAQEEIEWLYVFINKILFDLGLPFFFVTLTMAIIAVVLKGKTMYENLDYPLLGLFFYFMPVMFFEDSGQMRQGIAIGICIYSFKFIKERRLLPFLLLMYIALGFHKTSIVFIPAFWIVKIPMNSLRIFLVLLLAVVLSPLSLHEYFGSFLGSLTPTDVSKAYTGYMQDAQNGAEVEAGLNDIIKVLLIIILIRYDKAACEKVPYYEYMRNLAVFGLFLFYFMRTNAIFAVRLPGAYIDFLTFFCMPSILYAVKEDVRKMLYTGFMTYFSMMVMHFAKVSGDDLNFTAGKYQNVLWDGFK